MVWKSSIGKKGRKLRALMIFQALISPIPSNEINGGIKNYFFPWVCQFDVKKLRQRVEFNTSNQRSYLKIAMRFLVIKIFEIGIISTLIS
ncbi:hypothetical protein NFI90_00370 [Mesomycoplasma ovipneumoniae]